MSHSLAFCSFSLRASVCVLGTEWVPAIHFTVCGIEFSRLHSVMSGTSLSRWLCPGSLVACMQRVRHLRPSESLKGNNVRDIAALLLGQPATQTLNVHRLRWTQFHKDKTDIYENLY